MAKKTAKVSALEELHAALAKALVDRIANGEATAADLNVARAFLKDNNIDAIPTDNNELGKLVETLPFNDLDEVREGEVYN